MLLRRHPFSFVAVAAMALLVGGGAKALTRDAGVGCTPVSVRSSDGSLRTVYGPPPPILLVRAVARHDVRFDWRFRAMPQKCVPALLILTVQPGDPKYTPWTESVRVRANSGTHTIRLPAFYIRGRTALASAFTVRGLRSPVVRALVRG
jgi:hypothetical protein